MQKEDKEEGEEKESEGEEEEDDKKSEVHFTVKPEILLVIIFDGFEDITIWQRFNFEILLEESWWGPYFVHLLTANFAKIY